ncbi:unnamed protein product, partial [Chrysoparadoxa australica]
RNLNDVWVWHRRTNLWSEQITLGVPPTPRYGHGMVCDMDGKILILGGCCVSSGDEEKRPMDWEERQQRMEAAADKLRTCYELEDAEAAVTGDFLQREMTGALQGLAGLGTVRSGSECSASPRNDGNVNPALWKDMARSQAWATGQLAAREAETDRQEQHLEAMAQDNAAAQYWADLQGWHKPATLDLTILDPTTMVWSVPLLPKVTGTFPCARMDFCTAVLGRCLVVWGGAQPMGIAHRLVDSEVYVLDLKTMVWCTALPEDTSEGMQPSIDAAAARLRRAQRGLKDAKCRAISAGIPQGRTVEVLEAEAVAAVSVWRYQALSYEATSIESAPMGKSGVDMAVVGQRLFVFGGWGAQKAKGELLVMDVEQPEEKARRLHEEFHHRLERERQERDSQEAQRIRHLAMLEEMRKKEELLAEAAERDLMAIQDERSHHWAVSLPDPPELTKASATTLWLTWKRPELDARGEPLSRSNEEDPMVYTLLMRGGFRDWQVGDKVRVKYAPKSKAALGSAFSHTPAGMSGSVATGLGTGGSS